MLNVGFMIGLLWLLFVFDYEICNVDCLVCELQLIFMFYRKFIELRCACWVFVVGLMQWVECSVNVFVYEWVYGVECLLVLFNFGYELMQVFLLDWCGVLILFIYLDCVQGVVVGQMELCGDEGVVVDLKS